MKSHIQADTSEAIAMLCIGNRNSEHKRPKDVKLKTDKLENVSWLQKCNVGRTSMEIGSHDL